MELSEGNLYKKGDITGYENLSDNERSFSVVCNSGHAVVYSIQRDSLRSNVSADWLAKIILKGKCKKEWINNRFDDVVKVKQS